MTVETRHQTSGKVVISARGLLQKAAPFLSRVSILLLTRDIDIVILSVCLSVTRWYCMKTA